VDSGAADGFVISPAFLPDTFQDFVTEVVPLLQARGYVPAAHRTGTLRQQLSAHETAA
jgi:hypothetical protein